MDMPNEYYNQGRRRGNRPNDMFYQTPMGGMNEPIATFPNFTPMGGGNMSGPVATFPNSTPMGGGVGNYPMGPTNPLPVPGPRNRGTRIPGGPLQESPLQAPYSPPPWPPKGSTGTYDPPPIPGQPWPRPSGPPMKQPSPMPGDRGGTRIPGGPLQESPLKAPNFPAPPIYDPPMPKPHPLEGTGGGMGAQRSYSSSYNPNTNRNQNTTSGRSGGRRGFAARGNSMPATYNNPNRYSTGGNMNANRMRSGYRGASGSGGYPGQVSGRHQTPRGGGSYDTGGLYSPGSGGYSPRGHYDRYPRSPGMPSITTNRNYDNRRISNRNYDQRRTYNNTQTFNQGDTSIQGPRIAKKMGRMQGYNPMMHGSQSRQIGGLRNLQRMLMALRGGRR